MALVSEIHHILVFIIIFIVIHIIVLHQTNKNLNITLKQRITVGEGGVVPRVVQLHSATKEELVQQAEDYYDDQWNSSQANDVTLIFQLKYHPVVDIPPNFRGITQTLHYITIYIKTSYFQFG